MTRADAKIFLITMSLAALGASLHFSVSTRVPVVIHIDWMTWWLLAMVFYLVERFSVYLQWREHAVSYALVDLPIVVGLASLGATEVILAGVVAQAAHKFLLRPLVLKKAAFNVALVYFELSALTAVLGLTMGQIDVTHPVSWLVIVLMLAATTLFANFLVALNMWISGAEWQPLINRRAQAIDLTVLVVSISFAIVATLAIIHHPYAGVLVITLAAVLIVAYRRHRAATHRYESMKLLMQQMEAATVGDGHQSWTGVLQQVTAMFGARYAELCVFGTDVSSARIFRLGPGGSTERRLDEDSLIERNRITLMEESRVLEASELPSDIPEPQRRSGAVAVPLKVTGHIVGILLVADRAAVAGGFSSEHADELNFYAMRVGQAVTQGTLLESLRDNLDELRRQKYTDALTALPTQSAFYERMRDYPSDRLAVAVIGVANLAEINRAFGREGGDLVVTKMAALISGADAFAAPAYRLPGAKFAVAMHGASSDELLQVLQHRLGAGPQHVQVGTTNVLADIHCGIASFPEDGDEINEVLESAALAMSQSQNTHQRFTVYRIPAGQAALPVAMLKGELSAAIDADEIEIYLQPKVRLGDSGVIGAEVLARWRLAEHGPVRPDIFIALAEEAGLIHKLTRLIIHKALVAWTRCRKDGHVLDFAINLSAYDFRHDDFPAEVSQLLAEHEVPPERVTFEITESILMGDIAHSTAATHRLHDLGVRLSVDDFGTGYSSLAYLARLPLDEIKIDRSFIVKMDERPIDVTIVETLIELGRKLGMTVVAEGIESGGVLAMLSDMGCDQAQGYFIARPMDEESFVAWLAARASGLQESG